MIGGGDDHGVDIGAVEQGAIVFVTLHGRSDSLFGFVHAPIPGVGNRHELGAARELGHVDEMLAAAAAADQTEAHAVAGGGHSKRAGSGGGSGEKGPARKIVGHK